MNEQERAQQRERQANSRKRANDTERSDIKWLMKRKQGRRIMMRYLNAAGVFQTSFSDNALTMAFNEGNRNAGLRWLNVIHTHCPEQYTQMLQEHADERRAEHGESGD